MYVIIEAYGDKPVDLDNYPDTRRYGEPRVVSAHRTLAAAQRAWRKLDRKRYPNWFKGDRSRYDYRAILTPQGVVNYFGERLKSTPEIGSVQVRMGVYSDD